VEYPFNGEMNLSQREIQHTHFQAFICALIMKLSRECVMAGSSHETWTRNPEQKAKHTPHPQKDNE